MLRKKYGPRKGSWRGEDRNEYNVSGFWRGIKSTRNLFGRVFLLTLVRMIPLRFKKILGVMSYLLKFHFHRPTSYVRVNMEQLRSSGSQEYGGQGETQEWAGIRCVIFYIKSELITMMIFGLKMGEVRFFFSVKTMYDFINDGVRSKHAAHI